MELPQEYWRHCTLFKITSAIGTHLALDNATLNRTFGHYARVLVDIDFSKHLFEEILVEREGCAFKLGIVYERLPAFCYHCNVIGHDISACKWIHPPKTNENVKKLKQEAIHQAIKKEYVAKANAQQQIHELKPFAINATSTINVQQVLSIPTEASPEGSGASFTKVWSRYDEGYKF
jgi:hypothetical protein